MQHLMIQANRPRVRKAGGGYVYMPEGYVSVPSGARIADANLHCDFGASGGQMKASGSVTIEHPPETPPKKHAQISTDYGNVLVDQ